MYVVGWLILALSAYLTLRKPLRDAWMAYITPKVAQRLAEAQKRQRLIDDADYQHWHATLGDPAIATYGRFQP